MNATHAQGSQVLARDGTVLADGDDTDVTVVDAVPVRRVPTDLRALLTSTLAATKAQARAADITLDMSVDERVPSLVRMTLKLLGDQRAVGNGAAHPGGRR
jgi:hypothetical protein